MNTRLLCLALAATPFLASKLTGQQPADPTSPAPTGREIVGLPALNFDSDEGFGYGALVEMYDYGRGVRPYRFTLQPTVFLTTKGRRDVTVFFDAPELIGAGWRLSAFAGREQQLATPYYGIGNATPHDAALEEGANPYFYRFGRTRLRATADVQHTVAKHSRLLIGSGFSRSTIDLTPFDSGTTLLAVERGGVTPAPTRENYLRVGVIYDTRDQEIGATRGTWTEALVQHVTPMLGATSRYTRVTATLRHYVPVTRRVVFAQRFVLQDVDGEVPFHELATIQSSFKPQEGLGGASSIRGLPKNRYVGNALALSNSELRWHAADFKLNRKPSHLVFTTFLDAGRVWGGRAEGNVRSSTMTRGLHSGYGAGTRLGLGESFVVAVDGGHSSESTAVYIGLGYLF
jgi:Omp85 superfamily domain